MALEHENITPEIKAEYDKKVYDAIDSSIKALQKMKNRLHRKEDIKALVFAVFALVIGSTLGIICSIFLADFIRRLVV